MRVCVYNSFAITPRISRRSVSCGPLQVEMEYQKWEICQVHSKSPFLGVFNCCLHSCRVWSACRVFFFTYWHAQSPWLTKLQANEHMASWDSDLIFSTLTLGQKERPFCGSLLGCRKANRRLLRQVNLPQMQAVSRQWTLVMLSDLSVPALGPKVATLIWKAADAYLIYLPWPWP